MSETQLKNIIKELRMSAGLTQEQLAEKLAVSPKTVSRWERGEITPPLETIETLAAVLGTDIGRLLPTPRPHKETPDQQWERIRRMNNPDPINRHNDRREWVTASFVLLAFLRLRALMIALGRRQFYETWEFAVVIIDILFCLLLAFVSMINTRRINAFTKRHFKTKIWRAVFLITATLLVAIAAFIVSRLLAKLLFLR